MKTLITLGLMLFSSLALAQFSEVEGEGSSQFRILGKTWSPTFYSLASMEVDKANDSGGRLSTYNYFSFHTFLKGDYRFSLRVPFTYASAGTDRFDGDKNNPQQLEMQDIILEVRNPELTYLPWDMGLYWAARVYTPNSKFSSQEGEIARFRNHFIVSKVFSRYFEMDVEQRYYYYWQSRSSYRTSFTDEYGFAVNDVAVLTKHQELEHWVTAWGKITPRTGIGLGLIWDDTYYNSSKGGAENKSKPANRTLAIGPQARFPLSDNANFILVYEDQVDRDKNLNELGKFLAKNSQVVLHSFISF